MEKVTLAFFSLIYCNSFSSGTVPKPTADILAWTKLEMGMMYSFNMISMVTNTTNTQYFCIGVGGQGGWLPPASQFNPEALDLDNWLDAAVAMGARYAVLVAQHCSGFSMWPSDIEKETGFEYKYSTKYSPLRGGSYDVVREFIDSCKKHNVLPGIYYSLNQNYYLNVGHGQLLKTPLVPGQANVTQELYGKIVLAQLRELWTNYGQLLEIWFDGGCSVPGISDNISQLLEELQPHAVYFGGCAKQNNLRWVGTESGTPGYPLWSTSKGCSAGLGSSDGDVFCPAESDTTLQDFDHWFWRPGFPIRTLSDLQTVYYDTVGHNTNLLLNAAANSSGLIEDKSMAVYKQFGQWVQSCFSKPVVSVSGSGNVVTLGTPTGQPFQYNKLVVQEDQSNGEAVTQFTITQTVPPVANPLFSGQSIGNKLILNLANLKANVIVLNITETLQTPTIAHFGAYYCT